MNKLISVNGSLPSEEMWVKIKVNNKKGERYYYIDEFNAVMSVVELGSAVDTGHYKIGNYYRTEEEAVTAQKRVLRAYKC